MKILHVINSLGKGGAEKLLSDLLPQLNQACEVSLLVLTSHDDVYSDILKKQGVSVTFLTESPSLKKMGVFKLVQQFFKENQYDLIHVHLFPSQYFVALATKTPKVFTEHHTFSRRRTWYFRPFERYFYNQYQRAIFVSEQAKQSFEQFLSLKPTTKDRVIYNGIDLKQIQATEKIDVVREFKIEPTQKIISMVSSFKAEKDHETVIKAMVGHPEWTLLLLGDGARLEMMKQLVNELHLNQQVHFLGFRNDVHGILKGSDCVVQSSHSEGFGLGVVEAMACGCPVLVSDIDGLKEVVVNPAYRFEKGNVVDLQKKLNWIFMPEHHAEAIHEGLHQAQQFLIDHTVKQHIELYKEVVQ